MPFAHLDHIIEVRRLVGRIEWCALVGNDASLRASVGIGLIWASPFGPLRVDYAWPVAKEDFDRVQNLKFGISSSF